MANDTTRNDDGRRTIWGILGIVVLLAVIAAALGWMDGPGGDEAPTAPGEEAVAPAEENLTAENTTNVTNETNITMTNETINETT